MRFSFFRIRFISVVCCSCLAACSGDDRQVYVIDGQTMGTSYKVKLVSQDLLTSEEDSLRSIVQERLNEVDELMSTYKDSSDVSRINRGLIGVDIQVSALTTQVLLESVSLGEMTGGRFDVTIGPLIDLWGFGSKLTTAQMPAKSEIDAALARIGLDSLMVEVKNNTVKKLGDIEVDLSAIAKGFGVDRVSEALLSLGYLNFLIEVGGEIFVSGVNIQGKQWVLGIEEPDFEGRKAYTTVSIKTGALATSGDYRNYKEVSGQRYSHTIDPVTGYPVSHRLASVSVLSPRCSMSDALATALMVMGEVEGYKFALENKVDAYFIFREGDGFATKSTGQFSQLIN